MKELPKQAKSCSIVCQQFWRNRRTVMVCLILVLLTLHKEAYNQSYPKGFKPINDSLLVAQCEVTNFDFNLFLESQDDSVKENFRSQRKQLQIDSKLYPWDSAILNDYHSHIAFQDYPALFVSMEMAKKYSEWLSSKDSNFIYFVPSWQHYLAIYDIEKSNAVLPIFMGGFAKELDLNAPLSSDSCISLNRNYFPWGSSFFSKENILNANIFIPHKYRMSKVSSKSFRKSKSEGLYENCSLMPVGSFRYNYKGIHDLQGNVAEMICDTHFTFGGGYLDDDTSKAFLGILDCRETNRLDVGFRVFARPRRFY